MILMHLSKPPAPKPRRLVLWLPHAGGWVRAS